MKNGYIEAKDTWREKVQGYSSVDSDRELSVSDTVLKEFTASVPGGSGWDIPRLLCPPYENGLMAR